MDSRATGEFSRSAEAAEEETMAKKRARRVSFAETTAVHVFDRDEDFETPPETRPGVEGSSGLGLGSTPLGFRGDQTDSDDSRSSPHREGDGEDDEDGDENEYELFVRRVADSSSPGSTVGSVTSNEGDDLFGPVSTSFIRSGQLSEVSDDNNHDITLDSATFSLHFGNILASEDQSANSAGSIRTPTGNSTGTEPGSFMFLSRVKQPVPRHMLSNAESSGCTGDSNAMSLVVENSNKYDYGKLSPTLEGLLAKVNDSMLSKSQNRVGRNMTVNRHGNQNPEVSENAELHDSGNAVSPADMVDDVHARPHVSNGCLAAITTGRAYVDCSPKAEVNPPVGTSISELTQGRFSGVDKESSKDIYQAQQSNMVFANAGDIDVLSPPSKHSQRDFSPKRDHIHGDHLIDKKGGSENHSKISYLSTLKDPASIATNGPILFSESLVDVLNTPTTGPSVNQLFHFPSEGSANSASCLRAKRQQLFFAPSVPLQNEWPSSPAREQPPSSKRRTRHSEEISSTKNIFSKFRILETPKGEVINSNSLLVEHGHSSLDFEAVSDRSASYSNTKHADISASALEEHLISATGGISEQEVNAEMSVSETPSYLKFLQHNEGNKTSLESNKQTEEASSFHLSGSGMKMKQNSLSTDNPVEGASNPPVFGSSKKQRAVELNENRQVLNTFGKLVSSPARMLQQTPVSSLVRTLKQTPVSSQVRTLKQTPASSPVRMLEQGLTFSSVRMLEHKSSISENCSTPTAGKKRRGKEITLTEGSVSETGKVLKSPKRLPQIEVNNFGPSLGKLGYHVLSDNEACNRGGLTPPKQLIDTLSKTMRATKQPFSQSINNLNLQELDILEESVCELQRARKYERLCTDIKSLKKHQEPSDLHQKRVAEIRSLKEKLLYEQARLQIKSLRRDRLLKRAQQLQSGIQEYHKLKSSFMPTINKEMYLQPVSTHLNRKNQEEHDKVTSMRQEFEILDGKVKDLIKSFEYSCNINNKMNCDEIIKIVSDHLDKRNRCRVIRQHLQLWKLIGVVNQNDQCDITLNYCDFLYQRFTIKVVPASSFGVAVSLNDENIMKNFPNMNAGMAFHFVFNDAKGYRRLANSKCFQQETQAISFILGNLLDVLDEARVANIEIPNLISSGFYSHSASKLEMQLCFLSFKSGRKVTLNLDMTHLNSAIYTSEPSKLNFHISSTETTLPQSVLGEITGAVRNLRGGHFMIIRFCQCISQVVWGSS